MYRLTQISLKQRSSVVLLTILIVLAFTASTLKTVAVFLSLAVAGGLIGEMFRPFALTVSFFALFASLFVSKAIVLMMASIFIEAGKFCRVPLNSVVADQLSASH